MSALIAPGHVDPETGRVAVLVGDYAHSDLNGDVYAYWYETEAVAHGMDPWRLVDGIDPDVRGGTFDVWFANGTAKSVSARRTVYLTAKDAAQLRSPA